MSMLFHKKENIRALSGLEVPVQKRKPFFCNRYMTTIVFCAVPRCPFLSKCPRPEKW